MSKMLSGSPILTGDNTIPGIKIHKEVMDVIPEIFRVCREFGLDFYPTIIEFMRYDEISELAAYGGFPVRYPHWSFGMEYEELSRGYEHNQHRISEMVINSDPCIIYCLDSNSLVDNIDVIAHALGHNHFFKNNVFFSATDAHGIINKLANHGIRIRKYMERYGKEKVTEFIDLCLRVQTLIDASKAWEKKIIKDVVIKDEKNYHVAQRIHSKHNYMDEWLNTKESIEQENERVKRREAAEQLGLQTKPEKDIMSFLKVNAPLKTWQQDIMGMLYEEALYFAPQRLTKMANEGFASWVDYKIMCGEGLCGLGQKSDDAGIIAYAKHKMMVLGGKYSQNPYKLGFELLMDIEDRWNKGKFGPEWEECTDLKAKRNWNKNLGLGKEKVFEVVKTHNDFLLIQEFFTEEFCEKNEFFEYERMPDGSTVITNRDFRSIKKKLLQKYAAGGLPDIRLLESNHLGKGWMLLEHRFCGLELYKPYTIEVLASMYRIWQNTIVLTTKTKEGKEVVFVCDGGDVRDITSMSKKKYEEVYMKNKNAD